MNVKAALSCTIQRSAKNWQINCYLSTNSLDSHFCDRSRSTASTFWRTFTVYNALAIEVCSISCNLLFIYRVLFLCRGQKGDSYGVSLRVDSWQLVHIFLSFCQGLHIKASQKPDILCFFCPSVNSCETNFVETSHFPKSPVKVT
jgi:hypothetical protein